MRLIFPIIQLQSLRDQDAMIRLVKTNLIQAQVRMKMYVDQKSGERTYEVGDMVFFHL